MLTNDPVVKLRNFRAFGSEHPTMEDRRGTYISGPCEPLRIYPETNKETNVGTITELYIDGTGSSFTDAMRNLPKSVHDWPPPERVKDHILLQRMHEERRQCGVCSYKPMAWSWLAVELHHIVGGSKGRSDERTNLIPLCRRCHDNANTDTLPLARILFCKWRIDPEHTDWRRLAILKRQFLPEPEGPNHAPTE